MPNFARKPWRDYTAVPGHQGSDEAVVDLTGWSPATLDVMWEAYRDVLPSTKARKGTKQHLSSSPFVCIGEIIFASFPHLGVDHDSKIWRTSLAQGLMTFVNNEWILSDPAYVGCRHAAVKYSKKKLCGIFSPCQGNAPGRRSCSCPMANTPFEVQVTIN